MKPYPSSRIAHHSTFFSLFVLAAVSVAQAGAGVFFTRNDGQWPDSVLYRANISGAELNVTSHGVSYVYRLAKTPSHALPRTESAHLNLTSEGQNPGPSEIGNLGQECERVVVDLHPDFQYVSVISIEGTKAPFVTNFLTGSSDSDWHLNVPSYNGLQFLDHNGAPLLTLECAGGTLKQTYMLLDSAKLSQRMKSTVTIAGGLSATASPARTFADKLNFNGFVPVADTDERSDNGISATSTTVMFSTYLGYSSDDEGRGVTVGTDGSVYVCGYSVDYNAASLPTPTFNGDITGSEGFVYKFASDGTPIYRTFFGGRNAEVATDVAVNSASEVYLSGYTNSPNFAGTTTPRDTTRTDYDATFVHLNAAGNGMIAHSYFGGTKDEYGIAVALDTSGNAYLTGYTYSEDYPTVGPYATNQPDGDAFVTKFNPAGVMQYSTYLGGDRHDEANAIAVDRTGAAYLCGTTYSRNFPDARATSATVTGADLFIAKLAPSGAALIYATALRGVHSEGGEGIVVDSAGFATVCGESDSPGSTLNLIHADGSVVAVNPKVIGDTTAFDVLIARLNQTGDAILYSTLVGGDAADIGSGIALDASGNAVVVGTTRSTNYPTRDSVGGYKDSIASQNVIVTRLKPAGDSISMSTYLGGKMNDLGRDVAIAADGSIYVTGYSFDTTAFVTGGAYLGYQGLADAFLTKLNSPPLPGACFRGDGNVTCDGNSVVDIADVTLLVDHLFIDFASLPCPQNANLDGQDEVDIGDLLVLVDHLFISLQPLPSCP